MYLVGYKDVEVDDTSWGFMKNHQLSYYAYSCVHLVIIYNVGSEILCFEMPNNIHHGSYFSLWRCCMLVVLSSK